MGNFGSEVVNPGIGRPTMTTPTPRRGRPRSIPDGARVWAKRLTPDEIRAVEALVKRMRKKKR